MKTMRFSAITSDIERKIRLGVFGEKMPTTPELTAMYKCSKSTVTNALHPLVRSGLLQMHSRRGGLCIDRAHLRSGAIGIVGRWPTGAAFAPESNISSLLEQIRKDGFDLPKNVLSYEEGAQAIADYLNKKKGRSSR